MAKDESISTSEYARLMVGQFHDALRAALRPVTDEAVFEAAMQAFQRAAEKVTDVHRRAFVEFFDYENQVGFSIIGVDGQPISGRVRTGDMVSLASMMDDYRKPRKT